MTTTAAPIFLDDEALRKLTGYAQKAKQVAQLRRMGVPFWINACGEPVVACSAVQGGARVESDTKQKADLTPYVLRRA